MVTYPNQILPPNPSIQYIDPKTGMLTTTGLQFLQQMWAMLANTNTITPCTSTFLTNVYTLTPFPSKATPTGNNSKGNIYVDYANYMFVAAAASTGLVSAIVVPQTTAIKVYKSNGQTQATSGDLVSNGQYLLSFHSGLNSGNGGFVLR